METSLCRPKIRRIVDSYFGAPSEVRRLRHLRMVFQQQRDVLRSQREDLEASMVALEASIAALDVPATAQLTEKFSPVTK